MNDQSSKRLITVRTIEYVFGLGLEHALVSSTKQTYSQLGSMDWDCITLGITTTTANPLHGKL